MPIMEHYISHVRETDKKIQTNEEHSQGVALLAEQFATEFGCGPLGRVLGLLHDKGKETPEFQAHIRRVTGLAPSANERNYKGHAYVGGLLSHKLYGQFSPLLSNPIYGHHAGLYNYTEIEKFLSEYILPKNFEEQKADVTLGLPLLPFRPNDMHHLVRMLFSCLVDADYLDTEAFMQPDVSKARRGKNTLQELLPALNARLEEIRRQSVPNHVNEVRNYVQQKCLEKSAETPGLFSLTVPTGGGKTLSSIVWAMNHAVRHGKKRIIIAIPYTSIIVQTAATLKRIFGEENVLEHHSNFDGDAEVSDPVLKQRIRLATENWDYPIIVTTNVQLFESLFNNRPSKCRKLHNLSNSVLVLDEVQMLPVEYLKPIVHSLDSLNRIFGSSILFTTASQPALFGHIRGCNPRAGFEGLAGVKEIIPREVNLHERLRRVRLSIDDTPSTYDEVAARVARHNRVLCIVNTRRDAKEIFDRLPKEGVTLHLSRMMCPLHVNETIRQIKEALQNEANTVIRVVSTQLVEAGVDIDFPTVFRQEAGLDSLLQAAGRCNREGRLSEATAYTFSLQKEHRLPPGFISRTNDARKNMPQGMDWFAPETMTAYFEQLYSRIDNFDKAEIQELLYKPREMMFEDAALAFHLIEDDATALIVNWKDSMDHVRKLKDKGPSYSLIKTLSQYSVNTRRRDLQELCKAGAVKEVIEGFFVVEERAQYDEHLGLLTTNHWLDEMLIK